MYCIQKPHQVVTGADRLVIVSQAPVEVAEDAIQDAQSLLEVSPLVLMLGVAERVEIDGSRAIIPPPGGRLVAAHRRHHARRHVERGLGRRRLVRAARVFLERRDELGRVVEAVEGHRAGVRSQEALERFLELGVWGQRARLDRGAADDAALRADAVATECVAAGRRVREAEDGLADHAVQRREAGGGGFVRCEAQWALRAKRSASE